MAVDLSRITKNLLDFYDFNDRFVLSVGAGGGQIIEYGLDAKRVFAVDQDAKALEQLRTNVQNAGLEIKFTLIHSDFYKAGFKADVVLFEFCLHEMPDPRAALIHAQNLAPDILIFDHLPESEWAFITDEDKKASASWKAVESFTLRKKQSYNTIQRFKNYEELHQKVKVQGQRSLDRIRNFKSHTNIAIRMSYGLALL